MDVLHTTKDLYDWALSKGDPRVEAWPLMESPVPVLTLVALYLVMVYHGPRVMVQQKPVSLNSVLVVYNLGLVGLSAYMFYEFLVTSVQAGYSLRCQPVNYSNDPLALRMASVCWWYFFSKIIEFLDTTFFILRKKNEQITFLHVYHHSTMPLNWWLGVKFVAGGQAWFLAMLNCFVHILMYTYYGLSALGPHMQKYLWWKRYLTILQLSQFFAVILHTGYNMTTDCDFPIGFNYAVFIYAITLVLLFSNFFMHTYTSKEDQHTQVKGRPTHTSQRKLQ
ncbi:elongation of very long chain fatty acids protein 4-like [Mizuhopecten yessoensis]|uniref:elongation of very long chain fatty acids protein 4-like n=1 Tax=Mizuhopecten yessoensis TaxID=6573 RepID=UPI000B457867|nr:elongation of very long chain fatty acids protein 4-like [Mizuhopecten yessoensis]XP_021370681.1 elongation of very long chain fatty acids protein 4-like [Mizuhopecten yessoensis]